MSTYKLYYYNRRGRAEISRLILITAGQKFIDIRYEHNEWSLHKGEMPLEQMPILEFDNVKLPQSVSIARFLANQFQLAGQNNLEQAKVDVVVDTIIESMTKYLSIRLEEDEYKKHKLIKEFLNNELPIRLQNLDILRKLYSEDGPFFVNNQLTWADLLFYDISDTFLGLDLGCLKNYPWLKENRTEVEKQPRIGEYLKIRSKTNE